MRIFADQGKTKPTTEALGIAVIAEIARHRRHRKGKTHSGKAARKNVRRIDADFRGSRKGKTYHGGTENRRNRRHRASSASSERRDLRRIIGTQKLTADERGFSRIKERQKLPRRR